MNGWRMLADKDGQRVRLVSRHGRDETKRFTDVAAATRCSWPSTCCTETAAT